MTRPEACRRIAKYKEIMRLMAERHGMNSPQVLRISLRLDRLLNRETILPDPSRSKEGA